MRDLRARAPEPITLPQNKTTLRALKARLARQNLIELGEVRGRIRRAILTLKSLPDEEQKYFRIRCGLPEMLVEPLLDQADAQWVRNEELSRPRKFIPTPRDISRYLDDVAWLNPLCRRDQDIIYWRAKDFAYRDIGDWLNLSETGARNAYKAAISNCWTVAAITIERQNKKAA